MCYTHDYISNYNLTIIMSGMDLMSYIPKFSPHGRIIIFIAIIITVFFSIISSTVGSICFVLTLFCLYFFRDPDRSPIIEDGIVLAPADGIVTSISKVHLPTKFGMTTIHDEMWKISIFLNVFDIHVNRLPINGTIKNIIYSPGKFISALKEKENDDNECNTLIIEDEKENTIIVSQIAGMIARRIVCDVKTNDKSRIGDRFGIIRFGSRVNLYLPSSFKIMIKEGQRMLGGETLISVRDESALERVFNINKVVNKI